MIDPTLREQFEKYGENVVASALATTPRPPELGKFLDNNDQAALAWLTECREQREQREYQARTQARRNEIIQWLILGVAIVGVIVGVIGTEQLGRFASFLMGALRIAGG